MANTKVIRVSPEVYNLLTEVGRRLGLTPGSLLSQMLTYKCHFCGEPTFISSYTELMDAMEGIRKRMENKDRTRLCPRCRLQVRKGLEIIGRKVKQG